MNDSRRLALLGHDAFPLPLTGSPSHTEIKQDLFGLTAGTIEATCAIHALPTNGRMYGWVGWEEHDASDEDLEVVGVALYVESGDLKATLRAHGIYDPLFGTTQYNRANFGTSPVTIQAGYSLGTFVRVKVERRHYGWRAKVWMDGGSEPGPWTLEGFMPHFWPDQFTFPTVLNVSQYPYTQGTATEYNDQWGTRNRTYRGQLPALGAVCDPRTGTVTASGHVSFSEFTLAYDPVGARDTAHLRLEKYNGTIQYGTVAFDIDRVIVASLVRHSFDNDTRGFNVVLWAEAGAAELQATTVTTIIRRAPLIEPMGIGDIKFP